MNSGKPTQDPINICITHTRTHQYWRADGRKLSARSNSAGLLPVAVKTKLSSQSVPEPKRKCDPVGPTCSGVRPVVGSDKDKALSAKKEHLASEIIKTKTCRKDEEATVSSKYIKAEYAVELKRQETSNLRKHFITQQTQKALEELQRERATCVRLKEMLASAEDRAVAAHARCSELERQLCVKTSRAKWANNQKPLYINCRGTSNNATNMKKSEPNNNKGDVTMEMLLSQRDALQLKVKELEDHATILKKEASMRETDLSSRIESLLLQRGEQALETEKRLNDLQEQYNKLQERSRELVEAQHMKCLEYLPQKVPCSCEDLDILYDLQATKSALGRVRKELERSCVPKEEMERPDKEITEELLSEEQTISKLQKKIEEFTENKKNMVESLICYEHQISALRQEVSQLRSYNEYKSCNTDISHEELEKQVLDLCLQVERLSREREELASEAMTRSLLLERHERCAELFACVTRARRALAAHLNGTDATSSELDGPDSHEISSLMSKACLSSALTWSALRVERARVLRLEGVVQAQAQQLERESNVRVKQDRRRAQLERELLRTWASAVSASHSKRYNEADTLTSDSLLLCKQGTATNIEAKPTE